MDDSDIIKGKFYKEGNFSAPLFSGILKKKDEKLKIFPIDFDRESYSDYLGTLYGVLDKNKTYEYYTFFNCRIDRNAFADKTITFEDYISNRCLDIDRYYIEGKSLPLEQYFIKKEWKFNKIRININGLKEWLLNNTHEEILIEKFTVNYINKDMMHCDWKEATDYLIKIKKVNNKIKVLNKKYNFEMELNAYPFIPRGLRYTETKFFTHGFIDIISEKRYSIHDFVEFAKKIELLLSVLWGKKVEIESMYSIEEYVHIVTYCDNKDKPKIIYPKHLFLEIKYDDISDILPKIFSNFFKKYAKLKFMMSFINEFSNNIYFDVYFVNQIQCIEVYGNLISKGRNTKTDIEEFFKHLPTRWFNYFFDIKSEFTGESMFFDKEHKNLSIDEKKVRLANNISRIRNFFTHPYKDGKKKEAAKENIDKIFLNESGLNIKILHLFSQNLNRMLRTFVLKELGFSDKLIKPKDY